MAPPEHDRAALRATGTARLILHLQGFLFFGTANRLLEQVRAALGGPDAPTHLLLDFREVIGLDSSATMTFARLGQIATARKVQLVLTGLSPAVARKLQPLVNDPNVRRHSRGCRRASNWAMEEDALASLPPRAPAEPFGTRLTAVMSEANATRLLASLPMDVVPAGTVLMVQGEPAVDALLLEEGRVAIHIGYPDGHAVTLRLEGPGVLIGEMAFLFGMRRRATVTTETPCRLRAPETGWPGCKRRCSNWPSGSTASSHGCWGTGCRTTTGWSQAWCAGCARRRMPNAHRGPARTGRERDFGPRTMTRSGSTFRPERIPQQIWIALTLPCSAIPGHAGTVPGLSGGATPPSPTPALAPRAAPSRWCWRR